MKANSKKPVARLRLDLNSAEGVAWFRKAAENFTRRATKSPEAAREVLIKEGIYTRSGRLTKHYR